jgi:hypothetical protein
MAERPSRRAADGGGVERQASWFAAASFGGGLRSSTGADRLWARAPSVTKTAPTIATTAASP